MTEQWKKTIFYFDDDVDSTQEIVNSLNEGQEYEVSRGAHWPAIRVKREFPFDLVIIDLNIHHWSMDESGQEVENISYESVSWQRTGKEFLRRIRLGEYEEYGFSKEVKVIIASAVVDHKTKQDVFNLKISRYVEKPFTIEEIQEIIQEILSE